MSLTINGVLNQMSGPGALSINSSKAIITQAMSNGQLLIGRTGNFPQAATLTGTTNQITVTNASGSITLATPQNIHTAATPTFGGAFLNGTTIMGRNATIATGVHKLMVMEQIIHHLVHIFKHLQVLIILHYFNYLVNSIIIL